MDKKSEFSEKEAQQRFEAALRGALRTPATPLKDRPRKRILGKVGTKRTKANKSGK